LRGVPGAVAAGGQHRRCGDLHRARQGRACDP